MVSLPVYRIEPPDVIRLDVTKLVPRPSYRIDANDVLQIRVSGTPRNAEPIDGYFAVSDVGVVALGPAYGIVAGHGLMVRVIGLTTEEAAEQITKILGLTLRDPRVTVQLTRSANIADLSGVYAVQPDGLVVLENYGAVRLAGKTVREAGQAIEEHLAQYFDSPRVAVTVSSYSSAGYYVIVAGTTSANELVFRFPMTGNETVLDALAHTQIGGVNLAARSLWLTRPGRNGIQQILPIDWEGIARNGETATNYQILPGDRLYIVNDAAVAVNDFFGTLISPIQILLGGGTSGVEMISGINLRAA